MLKLKWASTSEQETVSSWPSQRFGWLPRNLKTGAGLSTVPARQLHLDTTLHGNAEDKPRKTGWTEVINWGGARSRKWSTLIRCSRQISLRQHNMQAIWKANFSYANRSHGNPWSLTQPGTRQFKLPPLLLLGGNGYNPLEFSPVTTSSLCNKKTEAEKKLKEIYSKLIWQLNGIIPTKL